MAAVHNRGGPQQFYDMESPAVCSVIAHVSHTAHPVCTINGSGTQQRRAATVLRHGPTSCYIYSQIPHGVTNMSSNHSSRTQDIGSTETFFGVTGWVCSLLSHVLPTLTQRTLPVPISWQDYTTYVTKSATASCSSQHPCLFSTLTQSYYTLRKILEKRRTWHPCCLVIVHAGMVFITHLQEQKLFSCVCHTPHMIKPCYISTRLLAV